MTVRYMIRRTFRQGDDARTSTYMVNQVDGATVQEILESMHLDSRQLTALADDLWNWGAVTYGWVTLTLTKAGPFSDAYGH